MAVSGGVRTAAVLFTDLAGSTVTRSRLGEVAAERLRVVHDGIVRRAIEGAGGTVVKTLGDGTMATFVSAADAVAAAVAVQQGIDQHNRRSSAERLGLRVGVSVGDVDFDGTDCHGLPVIEAQRLEAAARPGQILCADLVVALARGRGGHVFEEVGSLDLKGLSTPVAVSQVLWEPVIGSDDAEAPPVLRQPSSMPFAGRKVEADVLARAWARCREGGFALVLVAGEPGIGKTRLVSEAAVDARRDGATVLAGRCDEEIRVPFGPFVGALRWLVDHETDEELPRRLGKHPGELVTLVPGLAERMPGAAPSAPTDADTERLRLFEAVCSWLGAGSGHAATLIVLDDLHWADTGTVQLLRHLVGASPAGVLVLGTYRDTDISRTHPLAAALADLRQAASVTRIGLGGLDQAEVRDLVEAAGGQALEAAGIAFADFVCAETAGNPLFVGEVLRHLADTGDLVHRDGRWAIGRDLAAIGIPEGIREVIGRRLSRLPSDTEAVLRTAAVVGLDFDVALLSAVLDRSEDDVLDLLEHAVKAALVVEVGVGRFRFAHALVRETLHAELTASRRAREHRRIAEAVQLRQGDDADDAAAVLAVHWDEACAGGDPSAAVEWATRAGERDLTRRAPDEASHWFARALELLDEHPADDRRRHLMARMAYAQTRAKDPGAVASANTAASMALEAGDVEAAAAALCLWERMSYDGTQRPDGDKMRLLDQVLDRIGQDRPALRGRLLAQLAGELVFVGGFERRRSIVAELRELRNMVDDPVERWGLMRCGAVEPGERWVDRAALMEVRAWCLEAVAALGDPFERVEVFETLLWPAAAALGERDTCDDVLAAASREHTPAGRLSHVSLLGVHAYLDGRLGDFREHARAVVDHLESVRHPSAWTVWWCNEFVLRRELGTIAELQTLAVERPGLAPNTPRFIQALGVAITQLLAGQGSSISLDGLEPGQILDGTGRATWVAWLAEVAAAVGDDQLVEEMLRLVEPHVGMHLVTRDFYWDSYDRLTALLRDRLGDHELADEAFARAVEATQAFRTPVWAARSELDWAESLLRRSKPHLAAQHLRAARAAIGSLPLTDSRERAERLERALHGVDRR